MDEFDYFADELPAPASQPSGRSFDEQMALYQRRQQRYARYIALVNVTFIALVWFLWDYRYQFSYAFAAESQPRQMGEAETLTPADLPHNTYVTLTGITEHRGLTQKRVRGFGLGRDELWYFRLVGGQGIFVETPSESDDFGVVTKVAVAGRVVDPALERRYDDLLAAYHHKFYAAERPQFRIIQHGMLPASQRGTFVGVLVFLVLLFSSNFWTIWQLYKAKRMAPGRS